MDEKFYLDEECVVSASFGEIGWFLQHYQSRMRFFAKEVFKDRKMIIFTDIQNSVFLDDFVYATITLPKWFYDLNLDRDCYEAVEVGSHGGSLTPPKVYAGLIEYMKQFYNSEKAIEIFPPRGYNKAWEHQPQIFCQFETDKLELNRPVIVVFPRAKDRTINRNVPEFVWYELVEKLKQKVDVVLAGIPNGACLQDYESEGVINLIKYDKPDKTNRVITYLNNCLCSISSQSGGTHISLLSGANSYIIGHEKERHTVTENRLNVPTSFRFVSDYRAIDSDTILLDVEEFLNRLEGAGYFQVEVVDRNRPSLGALRDKKDLIGAEIGVFEGLNALRMLESLDIKKLYLIDPYSDADSFVIERDVDNVEKSCKDRLKDFDSKIVWIRKKAEDAIEDIVDELDFINVDGDHRYETVKKETALYYPKLKDNGLMSFHDFDAPDEKNGVVQAVTEYFQKLNIPIYSQICPDDPRTREGWIFKISNKTYDGIINNSINTLKTL